MVNKKLVSLSLSLALIASTALANPCFAAQGGTTTKAQNGIHMVKPYDTDKIVDMLKRSGTIPQNATQDQIKKILSSYLTEDSEPITKTDLNTKSRLKQTVEEYVNGSQVSKDGLSTKIKESSVKTDNVQPENWQSKVIKEKILVLVQGFSDLKFNNIPKGTTPMWYQDFTTQHYQDMIFGDNGYTGPNGENLVSMKQYYEQQSGGSYTIEGTVVGGIDASKTAQYYGQNYGTSHNRYATTFVKEALATAATKINLSDYDLKDFDDRDGDGIINEPDGVIDHLMVIHAGMGEEAGGGAQGTDAIWSHSSKVYSVVNNAAVPYTIPGSTVKAWNYTIMPEDGAAGVFCHEYGHDLGLPDEYDTQYSGVGEPIESWSIMSGGSWAGLIPGTEPTGFSPFAKEFFQATMPGSNWEHGQIINWEDIPAGGLNYLLDQGNTKGTNEDYIRINLPQKSTEINKPFSGTYEYFGGRTDMTTNSMTAKLDLTTAIAPALSFQTWYDTEATYDFFYVDAQVDGTTEWVNLAKYDGNSQGWQTKNIDLTSYKGKSISLRFLYNTDENTHGEGVYVDDITVKDGETTIITDNADATPTFVLNGFAKDNGIKLTNQHYYLEWRNHSGVDMGLKHILKGKSIQQYNPGLLIWYADEKYSDNWTGVPSADNDFIGHPGDGYLGLVDADLTNNLWKSLDPSVADAMASTKYQIADASFSLRKGFSNFIDIPSLNATLTDRNVFMKPIFDDSKSYLNPTLPDAGRNIPHIGLKIYVTGESKDRSVGTIKIVKTK